MTNYFFISSPLHFFIATSLSISRSSEKNIAIFMSKNSTMANLYSDVARNNKHIFQHVYVLPVNDKKNKRANRIKTFEYLNEIIEQFTPNNIFTGNDARVEFQYAMFKSHQNNNNVIGIYADDGIGSYLEHRSMNSFTRKYLETALKKLTYGRWWKCPLSLGATPWITKAYVAFPALVHRFLKEKQLSAIDHLPFESEDFLNINSEILTRSVDVSTINFSQIKIVICLTHENIYLDYEQTLLDLKRIISKNYLPSEIALKSHPRSKSLTALSKVFPESTVLPNSVGLELFLPLLNEEAKVIGDISTTLLTTKWLRPKITVEFFKAKTKKINSHGLDSIFSALSIKELDS